MWPPPHKLFILGFKGFLRVLDRVSGSLRGFRSVTRVLRRALGGFLRALLDFLWVLHGFSAGSTKTRGSQRCFASDLRLNS